MNNNYKDTLDHVIADIDNENNDSDNGEGAADDSRLVPPSSLYYGNYTERDKLYTALLRQYIENNAAKSQANAVYKCVFFLVVVSVFAVLTIAPAIMFCELAQNGITTDDAIAILGSSIGIVSAIVVLPRIIAEHLFPTKEDENMIALVKSMQENDSNIRSANVSLSDDANNKTAES